MPKTSHLPDISVFQYLRELEKFIGHKSRENHFIAYEFIKNEVELKDLQNKNDAIEAGVNSLVIKYCEFLENDNDTLQLTDDELNAITKVHNMKKAWLKEKKEMLISFSVSDEALENVENSISTNLQIFKTFLQLVACKQQ